MVETILVNICIYKNRYKITFNVNVRYIFKFCLRGKKTESAYKGPVSKLIWFHPNQNSKSRNQIDDQIYGGTKKLNSDSSCSPKIFTVVFLTKNSKKKKKNPFLCCFFNNHCFPCYCAANRYPKSPLEPPKSGVAFPLSK